MINKNQHIGNKEFGGSPEKLFSETKVIWEKSKEAVWDDMLKTIDKKPQLKTVNFNQRLVRISIAASIIVLLGIAGLGFYSQTDICPAGEHLVVTLPDASTVNLNASSSVKYFPYRWWLSRKVFFEGEGFFEVQKGKKFEVVSVAGTTQVLGTSFNIYSRDNDYKVTCVTGIVKVASKNKKSVLLHPNEQALVNSDGGIKKLGNLKTDQVISWRYNQFLFTRTPIKFVLKEIERQYNISISFPINTKNQELALIYTGNFRKKQNVEEVLNLVCKPLGINFVKKSDREYEIIQNN